MSKKQSNKSTNTHAKTTIKSMNEDLKRWLTEKDKAELSKKIKTHLKDKKPHGICQVCGTKTAMAVCLKCGKSVCNSCYFNLIGLCEKCLSKNTVEKWMNKEWIFFKVTGIKTISFTIIFHLSALEKRAGFRGLDAEKLGMGIWLNVL